jgi:hypothetical protein
MAARRFAVDKKYRPVFVGRLAFQPRAYRDTYDDIIRADNRAKAIVEEGRAIEAVVYEELGKGRRVRKITYQRDDNGEIKKTTNI